MPSPSPAPTASSQRFDEISRPVSEQLAHALRHLAQAAKSAAWRAWGPHNEQPVSATQGAILSALLQREHDAAVTPGMAAGMKLSELARLLNVTAATASQSVTSLQARSLLSKQPASGTARALAIGLTDGGRRLAAQLAEAGDPLQTAMAVLSPAELETLYLSALKMIRALQLSGELPDSGLCPTCRHFEPNRTPDSATPHFCHLVQAPFGHRHLRLACPEHAPADPEVQRVVWMKFAGSPLPASRERKTS